MKSALYHGSIFHRRFQNADHKFCYPATYFLLDLDELDDVSAESRLFSTNRWGWFSFHERDHGNGLSLKTYFANLLTTKGFRQRAARFEILTIPRVWNFAFNPISVVFCRDAEDEVFAIIYEVNNTFGDRIHYVAPVSGTSASIRQRCDKQMFVSPFFENSGHYEFELKADDTRLSLAIDYFDGEVRQLNATLRLARQELSATALRRLARRQPFIAVRVIAGIHFQALKLWLKGVPLVRYVRTHTRPSLGIEQ